jgi:hypothetical protein
LLEHFHPERIRVAETACNAGFPGAAAIVAMNDDTNKLFTIAPVDERISRRSVWIIAADGRRRLNETVTWPKMLVIQDGVL